MAIITGVVLPANGDRIKVENYNDPINKILAQVNGNLDDTNISTLSGSKITAGSIPYSALSTAAQTAISAGYSTFATPSANVYNGNHSYTWTVPTDYTASVSPGMRVKTVRNTPAPTQSTSLNGTTQYWSKSSPNKLTFTDDFTTSAWVKLTSYPSTDAGIMSRASAGGGWWFGINSTGQVILNGSNGAGGNFSRVTSYQSLPLNKWVHVGAQLDMSAFTASTTTSYVMFDGVDVPASVVRAGTNPTSLNQTGNLEVGSIAASGFFPGKIVQAVVYNVKVTQQAIRATISQGLTGSETGVASAFSFNGVSTDLNTSTPNDLTPIGSVTATTADSPFGGQANGSISSTIDYGIIQSITSSSVTVQAPEGCTFDTTNGFTSTYSQYKTPYGFPGQKDKWTLYTWLRYQATSTSNGLFGSFQSGGYALTVPVGSWNVGAIWGAYHSSTTAVIFNMSPVSLAGLSAQGGYNLSRLSWAVQSPVGGTYIAGGIVQEPMTLTSSSTYVVQSLGATNSAALFGDVDQNCLFAENAYL